MKPPPDSLPRPPVFCVPEGYFDSLPSRISARLAGTAPLPLDFSALDDATVGLLDDLPRQHPFQVPDGYFDRLRLPVPAAVPQVRAVRPARRRIWYGVAASVGLLLAGYWLHTVPEKAAPCPELLCHLTDDEVLHYLEKQDAAGIRQAPETLRPENTATGLSEAELLQAAETLE